MDTVSPTISDWIFFIAQIVLNLASIWLGIYFFIRQQRDAQNTRNEEIGRDLREILTAVKMIDRTTSDTHNHFVMSQTKMVEKAFTDSIMMVEHKYLLNLSETENKGHNNELRKQEQATIGER